MTPDAINITLVLFFFYYSKAIEQSQFTHGFINDQLIQICKLNTYGPQYTYQVNVNNTIKIFK